MVLLLLQKMKLLYLTPRQPMLVKQLELPLSVQHQLQEQIQ
jgi:hypothetical protein